MNESILPVSPEPILATDTSSLANTIPTEPSSPVEKCELTRDALRGVMVDLKKMLKVLEERQNAHHRCMTGRNLKDTTPGVGFDAAMSHVSGANMMLLGLDQIAFAAGITLE